MLIVTPSPTVFASRSLRTRLSLVSPKSLLPGRGREEDHQTEFVQEVLLEQTLDQLGAAVHDDVAVVLAADLL